MSISKRLRFEIFKRDGNKCRYCGATAEDAPLTIDHVVPVALGGSDEPSNLVTACRPCNSGKSSSSPDAALVSEVSEDALRWARAQEVAAAALVADLERRDALRAEFKASWNSWKNSSSRPMPLPASWPESVDRFVQAGLPMRVLLDCVDKAMRRDRIANGDLFRYMCGIAWSRVTELRNRTTVEVGGSVPAALAAAPPTQFARAQAFTHLWGHLHRLNDLCDPTREAELAAEFDLWHGDDEEGLPPWDQETKAASVLLEEQLNSDDTWGQRIYYLLTNDLGLDYGEAAEQARQELAPPSDEPIEFLALKLAVQRLKKAASIPAAEA